ncbi:hypothetical protein SSCHL_0335 [Staphylococcus schleiferi]|uniref:Phage protein n=1 Tax=Staphylococcus coagulans TaxID=74706 RepID=A0ABU1EZ15_9STAP|nr:hypothetical protein [Staphylococcus coagulans]BAS45115.1 hypothetical protein SSCHL_0335 [Staphylococcus schleiferi]MDR5603370.1 hypothetical protein [Staphylococcus coagulans]MDR9833356.1 hypothetical protein [Staphylococcus coagulans]MDU9269177.1 hypothetical protein [Staphylococcus coagulans]MDU9280583.1 hypothetical protein [Staphylococcus coagulans]
MFVNEMLSIWLYGFIGTFVGLLLALKWGYSNLDEKGNDNANH